MSNTNRDAVLRDFTEEIEVLAKLHILYRMEKTEAFEKKKMQIIDMIQIHRINVRTELDPLTKNLYQRYFA